MYRVALIGNRAHQNTYGPIFRDRKDCEIVALAEHHAEKGADLAALYGLPCNPDYDAVLERDDVDIVCIATDFYMKRTLLPKAAACGKHIFVDKTLARTVAEAKEILAGTSGSNVKIHLAYPTRFTPSFRALADNLRIGHYSRPVSYVHHFIRQFPDGDLMEYVSYPTAVPVNGGGELMNLGSHPVDLAIHAFGAPRRVFAHFETAYWADFYDQFGTEDVANVLFEYESLTVNLVTGRNRITEGESGAVNFVDVWCKGSHVHATPTSMTENGKDVLLPSTKLSGAEACVDDLINAIENDRDPKIGVKEGLVIAEVTTAAYQSAAIGQFIDLPLADERHPMISDDQQTVDGVLD